MHSTAVRQIEALIETRREQIRQIEQELSALENARSALANNEIARPKRAILNFLTSEEYRRNRALTPTQIAHTLARRVESSARNPKRVLLATFYTLKRQGKIIKQADGFYRPTTDLERLQQKWG